MTPDLPARLVAGVPPPLPAAWALALLLVAVGLALLARWRHLGVPVVVLLGGVLLHWMPGVPAVPLTRDLVFCGLLPPLVFEAAMVLPRGGLRPLLPAVVGMASAGLLLATVITMLGMHLLAGWPVAQASLFGALIAATDPVAVVATLKEQRAPLRLRVLLEAESLFNDGTAAVVFSVMLGISAGSVPSALQVMLQAAVLMGGGVLCGALVAGLLMELSSRTTRPWLRMLLSVLAAWGSFLLADRCGVSGVLSTLTAGLMFGAPGQADRPDGPATGAAQATGTFWGQVAFVGNAAVFLLIGLQVAQQAFQPLLPVIVLAIVVVLAGRAGAVYPVAWLFRRTPAALATAEQHVLVWGGLRGALGLALAAGLPDGVAGRAEIITVTCAVVAFSVLVQGLTLSRLLAHPGALHPAGPVRDSGEKCPPG